MIRPRYLLALLLLPGCASAANTPSNSAIAEGQKLAAELRSSRPEENLAVNGLLRIRDGDGRRTKVPFRYQIVLIRDGWQAIYETQPSGALAGERVVVVHAEDQPTRYLSSRLEGANGRSADPVSLTGDKAMVPFAGSDFWLADFGLEFLHWPQQRIVEEAKIRMRKGRPCKVLESANPQPNAAGYTRVRSWIDRETGKPILAEAYGPDNRLLKEFEVGSLTKVEGQWELKNIEMRNARTDSQTVLEFKYQAKSGD
ncbi:MAG TPA: outer membrane lipoprotein-sorting protein [Verrucomicrobiae bacterium]|nr:outer membrane lipoprotein-sorting protein [Verrucomicrobiae bacterium]